jgi:hypothetical protein
MLKMTTERKLKIIITLLVIVQITGIFLLITNQRNHRIELEQLETEKSKHLEQLNFLYDELFIEKGENGRHELTREEVLSKYPKVKTEYEYYYEHETE